MASEKWAINKLNEVLFRSELTDTEKVVHSRAVLVVYNTLNTYYPQMATAEHKDCAYCDAGVAEIHNPEVRMG